MKVVPQAPVHQRTEQVTADTSIPQTERKLAKKCRTLPRSTSEHDFSWSVKCARSSDPRGRHRGGQTDRKSQAR